MVPILKRPGLPVEDFDPVKEENEKQELIQKSLKINEMIEKEDEDRGSTDSEEDEDDEEE